MSRGLLRWGLPRDPAASSHLAGFVVAAVVTVLLTRALLAAIGYPQIGAGGLHVAHVLWGGLLMALAFVLLLSFAGPVARPAGALVGGVGFGLFVDEVGKFVTADNNYFYEPTAALIYLVLVALVLVAEALHGRAPHEPREYLAGAADHAVAGIVGGFTPRARAEADALLDRAGSVAGAAQVRALLDAVDDDAAELPNPVAAVGAGVVRVMRRLVTARWVPWVTVGVLLATLGATVSTGLVAWRARGGCARLDRGRVAGERPGGDGPGGRRSGGRAQPAGARLPAVPVGRAGQPAGDPGVRLPDRAMVGDDGRTGGAGGPGADRRGAAADVRGGPRAGPQSGSGVE